MYLTVKCENVNFSDFFNIYFIIHSLLNFYSPEDENDVCVFAIRRSSFIIFGLAGSAGCGYSNDTVYTYGRSFNEMQQFQITILQNGLL